MQLYRSTIKSQSEGNDYSATYTYTIGEEKGKGSCYGMFQDETSFNSPVKIGNNVSSCAYMLSNTSFNQPIVIPNNVNNTAYMFLNSAFNQPIIFPSNCFCAYALFNTPFNCDIVLGENCRLVGMLANCKGYNRNLQIPDSTITCEALFRNCQRLNQNIKIPSNASSCSSMFESTAMNQDITIPSNVRIISRMLFNTPFGRNVYIKGNVYRSILAYGLFDTSTKRKNIWFHSSLNNEFNNTGLVGYDNGWSIKPTWTSMTNGFYNTQFNIYCYYNYTG